MSVLTLVFLVLFLFSIISLLAFVFWIGRKGTTQLDTGSEHPEGNDMSPYLYMGLFYVNSDDPRGWLPKKTPILGWTVNFRHKKYAHLFIVLLVTTLLVTWGFVGSLL